MVDEGGEEEVEDDEGDVGRGLGDVAGVAPMVVMADGVPRGYH